ncbi:MAG: PLDc N-terminal domain-containing protein [Microbacterium sp.]
MTQSTKDLDVGRRVVYGIFGVLQAALAFLAYWDLAHRPASQVHGPKAAWIPVILINWIGPLSYFYVHRSR